MQARIQLVEGRDPAGELVSLKQWLTRDDELRGRVTVSQPQLSVDGMGGVADAVVVALGSGGAATVLAGSLSVWLRSRRADVTIEVTGPDGRNVRVVAKRVSDPNALILGVLQVANSTSDQVR